MDWMKKIALTEEAALALNHCLSNVVVKGKKNVFNHAMITRGLIKNCTQRSTKQVQTQNGVQEVMEVIMNKGEIIISPEAFDLLDTFYREKIDNGLSGNLIVGYADLGLAMEAAADVQEDKEKGK